MKSIGLLSDTHGFIHDRLFSFFENADEIWHAGDLGGIGVADRLAEFKPLRAVYGNIDGQDVRSIYPVSLRFMCEEVDTWITHIGGYPGAYDRSVRSEISVNPPRLFISGHSHILKVIYDNRLDLLHINPGAAGLYGFHKVSTAVRFIIDGSDIRNLEIWETEKK
ncbi:MAG: metallophosphoesterase family protein [Prolixibacteraceae bacterium]|nr:metallophosphoesterase family protein [Prolixibacteraceae bacterium]